MSSRGSSAKERDRSVARGDTKEAPLKRAETPPLQIMRPVALRPSRPAALAPRDAPPARPDTPPLSLFAGSGSGGGRSALSHHRADVSPPPRADTPPLSLAGSAGDDGGEAARRPERGEDEEDRKGAGASGGATSWVLTLHHGGAPFDYRAFSSARDAYEALRADLRLLSGPKKRSGFGKTQVPERAHETRELQRFLQLAGADPARTVRASLVRRSEAPLDEDASALGRAITGTLLWELDSADSVATAQLLEKLEGARAA